MTTESGTDQRAIASEQQVTEFMEARHLSPEEAVLEAALLGEPDITRKLAEKGGFDARTQTLLEALGYRQEASNYVGLDKEETTKADGDPRKADGYRQKAIFCQGRAKELLASIKPTPHQS